MSIGDYRPDSRSSLCLRPLASTVDYSDGDEAEDALWRLVGHSSDLSAASPELIAAIRDWPSEYHLSPARHNLLRFLGIGPQHEVLELGCGCGALTRFFGEAGASVLAVEGSPRRAEIAARRCRDLPNVTIQVSDLMMCAEKARFDVVTLIGVLEYAPKYIDAPDPVRACLAKAISFLAPGGVLLIAIENKLGLRYFSGLPEDHLGIPYHGILDLYRKDEPITFGRTELQAKLRQAGLPAQAFFYPFPDYKLPKLLLTESAIGAQNFLLADLLALMASRDPAGAAHPTFHEPLAWRGLIANGLLPDLANSFLVVAGRDESALARLDRSFLAATYTADRLPAYAAETVFRKTAKGIQVEKRPLFPAKRLACPVKLGAGELRHRIDTVAEYIPGELYLIELQRRLARGEGIDAVSDWAAPWLRLLRGAVDPHDHLPGDWLDAIPQNFIRMADGGLCRIDQEWALSCPVPLSWVVIRGLINAFGVSPTSPALASLSLQETIRQVAKRAGICLDEADFRLACVQETELRVHIYGKSDLDLASWLRLPPRCTLYPATQAEWAAAEIARLSTEIARIKATFSWQVTKPLRLIANLPRHVRRWFLRQP